MGSVNMKRYMRIEIILLLLFLFAAGAINYANTTMNLEEAIGESNVIILYILVWSLLYLPVIYLMFFHKYSFQEFGINDYTINRSVILGIIFLTLGILAIAFKNNALTGVMIAEAFSRTGEEVFFRGYVYSLIGRLFKDKEKPQNWAIVGSSLLFASVHMQAVVNNGMSGIVSIFSIALFLGFIRRISDSIIIGIVFHCFVNSGTSAALVGITIYLFLVALKRTLHQTKRY